MMKPIEMGSAAVSTAVQRITRRTIPSPRPSGERVRVRGFEFQTDGLLTPTLSSFSEEREKISRLAGTRKIHAN
jgi:hypothetical protein